MATLKIRDENGKVVEVTSIKGKSAYDYAKEGGYEGTEKEFTEEILTRTGIEITSDEPVNHNTILTVDPNAEEVNIYTADEIDEMFGTYATDLGNMVGGGVIKDISDYCVQNEVSGTGIVTCDYVNENEHDIEVQLSSDTIEDFSGVTIETWGGNNFFSLEKAMNPDNYISHNLSHITAKRVLPIRVKPNISYTFSRNTYDNSGCNLAVANNTTYMSVKGSRSREITSGEDGMLYVYFAKPNSYASEQVELFVGNHYTDISLKESATTRLDYYADAIHITGEVYNANAKGIVRVKNIPGTMNIVCSVPNVNISAKYYQEVNADYGRFWDNFQVLGTKTYYYYGFAGTGWKDSTFRPKYNIKATDIQAAFYDCRITDLKKILEELNVVLDISQCTNVNNLFYKAIELIRVPVLNCKRLTSFTGTFNTCSALTHIYGLENVLQTATFSNTFGGCTNLEYIRFTGTIGKSISFAVCSKLSNESVQNIIDCLADLTGGTVQTLTLHTDVKSAMTEEQIAQITAKNWNLA